uniref:Transmembrane protein 69 n=1 Tax=Geotrypetes seraphini TaxID=260995 RepID=A0A6P8N967_GEOSA|nr:transmembrane protein 69 [Geotrypetes seraphini]XP_033772151.1 transmembrane protein 69 [Geotrypetes seraphini]XP_033772152.1 transmembrane protein 69 [Geotrypetes seraphini]
MFTFLRRASSFQRVFQAPSFPALKSSRQSFPTGSCVQGWASLLFKPALFNASQAPALTISQLQGFHSSPPQFKKRKAKEEPQQRELDLLRYDMRNLKEAPKPALYLSFAGLIPFVSVPLIMAVTKVYYVEVAFAQVAYGACMLSFFGGIRWGFALLESSLAQPDWLNLVNSMVPALLAWIALLYKDLLTQATIFVIIGLGIALHYDLALLLGYPSWFKALRAIVTIVAVSSLVVTLLLKGLYPEKSLSDGQN